MVLKIAITGWYIMNSILYGNIQNTKRQSHITLLACDLNLFFNSSCRTSLVVQS
jgi:hypothetical protein